MIYTGDYEKASSFLNGLQMQQDYENNPLYRNFIFQLHNAGWYKDFYQEDYEAGNITEDYQGVNLEDLIVIRIDGYYNVAKIVDNFTPIEISTTIYPFDKDKVYPIQEVEQKYSYKIY